MEGLDAIYEVVALGTGSKCLGENELSLDGSLVHDSHAEIIAKRAFIMYLLNQLEITFSNRMVKDASKHEHTFDYIETDQNFRLKSGVKFHFYSSHPPCGDATIAPKHNNSYIKIDISEEPDVIHEQIKRQKLENRNLIKDIHRTGAKCIDQSLIKDPVHNTDCPKDYHILGAIRKKPGRGDPTESLSCSDKMAKWNFIGLQGSFLSVLLQNGPIMWSSLTIGSDQFNAESVNRSLFSRFNDHENVLRRIPLVHSNIHFQFSKSGGSKTELKVEELIACSSNIAYAQAGGQLILHEVLVDGRKQGITKKHFGTPKSRVSICRLNISKRFLELLRKIHMECDSPVTCDICEILKVNVKYCELKLVCQNKCRWYKNRINTFNNILSGLKEARQLRRRRLDNFYI